MDTIEELRSQLFTTLRALNDKDQPMELDRAKAVAQVAQVIINSAKVEVDAMRIAGVKGTGFIGNSESEKPPAETPTPAKPNGITGITRHIMK